jgi:hypothetical protein
MGTFSALNYIPDRPEAEIMKEYVEAWDYLYEPSRYLARVYRYYLAMRPVHRDPEGASGGSRRPADAPQQRMTWRQRLNQLRSIGKIIWWQGIRPPYRSQYWTQLIGIWRQNPSRLKQYCVTCVEGEDFFDMRRMVREKITALIKERHIEVPAAAPRRSATSR